MNTADQTPSDPKEIVQWWGPHGFTTDTERREFTPAGMWKHTMTGPDGVRYPNAARYEEIVEGDLVVREYGAIEGGKQSLARLAADIAGDFLISRLVAAPRERVWQCWTEPQRLDAYLAQSQ